MDQRERVDDLRIPVRRWPAWSGARLLARLLPLCAIGTGAPAEQPDFTGAMGRASIAPPRSSEPCPALWGDEQRVSAIYLDLEATLRVGGVPAGRIRRPRWFCVDSELAGGGGSLLAPGAGLGIELISTDPSALTLVLESESGEIWEVELARPDARPLEPAAFASERAGFFLNLIEWTGDAELTALDADFEVALAGGDRLRGRVLWNAPWTPDEAPFVPLSDADWRSAGPGDVAIRGSDLDRLFRASGSDGIGPGFAGVAPGPDASREVIPLGVTNGQRMDSVSHSVATSGQRPDTFSHSEATDSQRMDSVRYSPDPVKDARAARQEVAEDLALLSAGQPTDATAAARLSRDREGAAFAADLRAPTVDGARRGASAPAHPPPPRTGSWDSTGSAAPIQRSPARVFAAGLDAAAPADVAPAGIEAREPRWPAGPDPSLSGEEGDRASEAARPDRCRPSRGSEDPDPIRVCGVVPAEGASGLDLLRVFSSSQPAGSGATASDPLEARDRTGALGRAGEGVGSLPLRQLLEEWWFALRTLVARWLHAMDGSALEARP